MFDSDLPKQRLAFWIAVVAAFALCAIYAAQGDLRGDEYVHFEQVERFRHGDFRILGDALTTLPGYHLLLAAVMRGIGIDSLGAARLLSGLSGLFAVWGFHRLRREIVGTDDFLATAQFALLPILLPFVFLIYTDTLSLALMLWATWAARRDRHVIAAVFLLAAIGVRQNNVLWMVFLVAPVLQQVFENVVVARTRESPPTMSPARAGAATGMTLARLLPYVLVGLLFVAYWRWNGSVSLSTAQAGMHPDLSLHIGNVVYLFFLGAVLLFLPGVDAWSDFLAAQARRPWLGIVPIALVLLYVFVFKVDHPYNLGEPVALRNWLLQRTQQDAIWHWIFGMLVVFGGVALLWLRRLPSFPALFWPVCLLFLSMSWLIEQRYCLIPLALLLAWRKPSSRRKEWITLALWLSLAVLFFGGMISGRLYL